MVVAVAVAVTIQDITEGVTTVAEAEVEAAGDSSEGL